MESDMTDGDGGPTNFSNKNFDGAVEILNISADIKDSYENILRISISGERIWPKWLPLRNKKTYFVSLIHM